MGLQLLLTLLAGWLARQQQRGLTEGQENTMGAQPSTAADGSCGPQKLHRVLDDILPTCENRRGHSPVLRRMLWR